MKINDLIYSIKIQDLVLPEFQREYVWTRDQAKKLMSSLELMIILLVPYFSGKLTLLPNSKEFRLNGQNNTVQGYFGWTTTVDHVIFVDHR